MIGCFSSLRFSLFKNNVYAPMYKAADNRPFRLQTPLSACVRVLNSTAVVSLTCPPLSHSLLHFCRGAVSSWHTPDG